MNDIYEWTPECIEKINQETFEITMKKDALGTIFHSFHESGLAREFLMDGYFEGTITWDEGASADDEIIMQQIVEGMKNIEGVLRWNKNNSLDLFSTRPKAE